ncbi:MAG: FAD-dependent oxidoreductase [Chloroflexi bacterium]|nr:FAD-dependent oxidoreductase [Chloroflexota bacterium]
MKEISLIIDGKQVNAREGMTVLEAAIGAGIYIPTICYHPTVGADGSCGLCLVEIEGKEDFLLSCETPASQGMVAHTDTPQIREKQKEVLKTRILAEHPSVCLTCERRVRCQPYDICLRNVAVNERCVLCPKNRQCELQRVVDFVDLEGEVFTTRYRNLPIDRDNPLFERDYNLCIGCGRCVRVCRDVRGIEAIKLVDHDGQRWPEPSTGKTMEEAGCRFCRACVEVCPTGALIDKEAKYNFCIEKEEVAAPCRYACPAHIDVPRYVYLIGEGRFADALAMIREKVPFPASLGRVCIHPCETACNRGDINNSICIKFLKRFAAEGDQKWWKQYSVVKPPTGKKVAVIGAGPGGLTDAYYLAKAGHSVTVFEALPVAGGMMRVGIPDYRLPPEVLESEINEIRSVGVDIKLNTRVESIDDLFKQGFDAVFVAVGAHNGMTIGCEGESCTGVMDGASFLRKANLGEKLDVGEKVAVIGGGNVAIDGARVALRLGAKEVSIVYRRTRAEMPASPEEVEAALHENIKFIYLAAPQKIASKGVKLEMTCIRMKLGEPDASGRRSPEPIKGSEFTLEFDTIIAAIGQTPDIPAEFNLKTGRGNTIRADSVTQATSRKGVFAGGDVATGPASVIGAIAAGRRAASSIDKYLGGSGVIDEVLVKDRAFGTCVGKAPGFFDKTAPHMPELTAEQRAANFNEVELGFDREAAVAEGRRCLQCAVRLQFPAVPRPPVRARDKMGAHR